jgi:bifunctional DNA-binding transcriptional regulator/antitoxin component of YhaV-PrlF toxin-antitoxin module
MGADVEVRIAAAADLDVLARLAGLFRDHLGRATPVDADLRASITALLQDPGTEFFLASSGPATWGYVQCRYRYSAWSSAPEAELEDVFVVHQACRHGAGVRLVEFAITRAAAKGCQSIGLNTNERMARHAHVVRLSSKGQLVIPAPLRRKLGLKTGQALAGRTGAHREIVFSPAEADLQGLETMLRRARSWAASRRRDLVEELHERRRREREREDGAR